MKADFPELGKELCTVRHLAGVLTPCAGLIAMIAYGPNLNPALRLLLGSVGLLYLLKAILLLRLPMTEIARMPKLGLLLFMTIWPGMDLNPFMERKSDLQISGSSFVSGYVAMLLGTAAIVALALFRASLDDAMLGWAGIVAVLMAIHFGYAQILTCGMRLMGWDVQPLFDAPLKSSSLSDFWSHRWNRPFVDMNKALFLPTLRSVFGPAIGIWAVFIISGILHEIGISYPAWSHWGLPLLYFSLQGSAVLVERKLGFLNSDPTWAGRIWTWTIIFLPIPLLFHEGFRLQIVVPFINYLHVMLTHFTFEEYLRFGLWLAVLGHLLIPIASLQVPVKLKWHEELARLSPLNRKLMWTYGGYTLAWILSFALLTGFLHDEMMAGEKGALCLALIIALFWGARILIDIFYYEHKDWPVGPQFVIGHTLLTSLFVFLTAIYSTLIGWHLVGLIK